MRRWTRRIAIDVEYFMELCWVCNRRRWICQFQTAAYVNFYMGVI